MIGGVAMAKKYSGCTDFRINNFRTYRGLGLREREISAEEASTKTLKQVEVRQYHGENLSSVNDFRENSIKGPSIY